MREPRYRELQARANREAYRIWLTRNDEPEPVLLEVLDEEDGTSDAAIDAKRIWGDLEQKLRRRDVYVLNCVHVLGMTFKEIAETLDLSVERVRQIAENARRVARHKLGLASAAHRNGVTS